MTGMCRYVINRFRAASPRWSTADDALFEDPSISKVHQALPEYRPTPLISSPSLAQSLGIGNIFVKDESHRFGLKAFKALGASYAIYRWAAHRCEQLGYDIPSPSEFFVSKTHPALADVTFCTATDGNHGRGVAWVAQKLGRPARIYMPAGSVEARVDAIRSHGAEVIVVDGDYDTAVRQCTREAEHNRWQVISDTSWPGYTEIPEWIDAAYTTIFNEINDQRQNMTPDIIIVPGGVGALAAAAAWVYNREVSPFHPKLVCVEPTAADCLTRSAESPQGQPVTVPGSNPTIMAGLNCGTPSIVAWPLIRIGFDGFVVIDDDWCRRAMRTYYYPPADDPQVIAGESGAASLAAVLAICQMPSMSFARSALSLTSQSTILVLNTEGDTDPVNFARVISEDK